METNAKATQTFRPALLLAAAVLLLLVPALPARALDTDVYKTNIRPNVAIMLDTSGSMEFGVYDSTVDYGAYYTWASDQGDCDLIAGGQGYSSNHFYADPPGTSPQYPRNEILLVKGNIGVTITSGGVTYTGDAGDPDYLWYTSNVIHTYTFIDNDGNLTGDGDHTQRITTDTEGYILLDGERLPLDRDIKLHDWQDNPDGTKTDLGFGGQINAPGWYFSGFEGIGSSASSHDVVEDGDVNVYFFIPGNWINMQMMYNLYQTSYKDENYRTWKTRTFPNGSDGDTTTFWQTVSREIKSKNFPDNYPDDEPNEVWRIRQPDATKIKIHFTDFNVSNNDYVKFFKKVDGKRELLEKFDGNKGEFWAGPYDLGTDNNVLIIVFNPNDKNTSAPGFRIDQYQYLETVVATAGYKMQRRIDVVRDAILYVVDATRGKINWALASFTADAYGDGAVIWQGFDPDKDDNTMQEDLTEDLNGLEPNGGTPLGEALQDIFKHFASKEDVLPECSRNFCITISDGFPSTDDKWSRIGGETFTDADGDGWTQDPYQYDNPPDDYFDDVATYLYHHSIREKDSAEKPREVSDPENSYDNITSHMLSFIQGLPLLQDAAEEGGGMYLAAYNKQQLVNAFYSLGLLIIKSTSYVAPVISVDTANKTQNGDMLYMAFFKPTAGRWSGNLKKYQIAYKFKSYDPDEGCPRRTTKEWVVVDKDGSDAVDCKGAFYESSVSFWSTEGDGGEVEKGGVGALLKAAVAAADMTSNPYLGTGRKIFILGNDGSNTQLLPDNIDNDALGVDNEAERYKIINYLYGYTYAEDGSANHYPVARRSWPLGSFIHSSPVIVNYESEDPQKTYIVIGGNDGMLHVFDDENGAEVVAFIPENLLPKLKEINPDDMINHPSPLFYVDGPSTYYFTFNDDGEVLPRQLIFGERRGGSAYYSVDISNADPTQWTKNWMFDKSTDGFSELGQSWSKISLVKFRTFTGSTTPPKVIGVFCGGYDDSGDGHLDPEGADSQGRGVYFIDILKNENDADFLVRSFTNAGTTGMDHAIPCDPLVLTDDYGFFTGLYFADLGGQVWHLDYDNSGTQLSWNAVDRWTNLRRVFTANPGSDSDSTETGGNQVSADAGRKMFYAPAATYLGRCDYVINDGNCVCRNDDSSDDKCEPRSHETVMLMFGTGDREQPGETDIHNRIYAVLDPYTDSKDTTNYQSTSAPLLDERNLLNVTGDELDIDSGYDDDDKRELFCTLSKTYGWYIKLDEISDSYLHEGEKVLSQPLIFFNKAYITTFTPNLSDPCYPHGEAKVYGLNYCNGTAGLNYYLGNDVNNGNVWSKKYDYRDRYRTIGEAIASSPKIVIREGTVAAFSSVGGGLPGLGENGSSKIPQPKFGINMINWFSSAGGN